MSVERDSDMTREEGIENVYDGPSHVVILGAGASIASTIHNPEPSGKKLPSIDNFIEVVGLKEILDSEDTDCRTGNFEEIYSCLYTQDPESRTIRGIGQKVFDYFSALRLPDTPTIYDYLLMALRPRISLPPSTGTHCCSRHSFETGALQTPCHGYHSCTATWLSDTRRRTKEQVR